MPNLKTILAGTDPLPSDINQLVQLLSGQADIGVVTLAPPTANPSAPTLGTSGAGNLNGAYKYQLVNVTGWVDTTYNLYVYGFAPGSEATISATNQQVTVTLPTFTAPVIATAIYRTAAGGATGTEKFVGIVTNGTATSFVDNVADANRGTGMPNGSSNPAAFGTAIPASVPPTNNTGTYLAGAFSGNLMQWL